MSRPQNKKVLRFEELRAVRDYAADKKMTTTEYIRMACENGISLDALADGCFHGKNPDRIVRDRLFSAHARRVALGAVVAAGMWLLHSAGTIAGTYLHLPGEYHQRAARIIDAQSYLGSQGPSSMQMISAADHLRIRYLPHESSLGQATPGTLQRIQSLLPTKR